MSQEGIGEDEEDGEPDAGEGGQAGGGQFFAQHGEGQEQLHGGGDELDEADGQEGEAAEGEGEGEQWDDGDESAGEDGGGGGGCGAEVVVTGAGEEEVGGGGGQKEGGFDGQGGDGIQGDLFAEEAVESEGEGEGEGEPAPLSVEEEGKRSAEGDQGQGGVMGGAEAFAEQGGAEGGVDQGQEEVAVAGFGDAIGDGGVNVQQPVDGQQTGGRPQAHHQAAVCQSAAEFRAALTLERHQDQQQGQRPGDPLGQDFPGGEAILLEHGKIEGHQTPAGVGEQAPEPAAAGRAGHGLLPSPAESRRGITPAAA